MALQTIPKLAGRSQVTQATFVKSHPAIYFAKEQVDYVKHFTFPRFNQSKIKKREYQGNCGDFSAFREENICTLVLLSTSVNHQKV